MPRWPHHVLPALRAMGHELTYLGGRLDVRGLRHGRRSGAPRIAFQCFAEHHLSYFRGLLRALHREGLDVEVIILPHPHVQRAHRRMLSSTVRALGFPARAQRQVMWSRFDVVLHCDAFARRLPRGRRHVLLMHGFGVAKRYARPSRLRRWAFDFDAVLCGCPHDAHIYEARRPPGNRTKISSTGTVLLDRARDPDIDRQSYLERLGLSVRRKTVLFAPHWTRLARADKRCLSSIRAGLAALERLDVNVVLKIHAQAYHRPAAGGHDWVQTTRAWSAPPARVRVDPDVDDAAALAHCDVVVTDVSSRSIMAAALGKPAILFHDDAAAPVVREHVSLEPSSFDLICAVSSIARSPRALAGMVEDALETPPPESCREALSRAGIDLSSSAVDRTVAAVRQNILSARSSSRAG